MQLNHWPYFPVCLFFCWVFFFLFSTFPPSPLLHRSCCTSCPFSPRKRIFTSSSNIFQAQKVWQMKKEPTPCPLSGSAHAVSGNFPILYADAAYRLSLLHKHFCHTSPGRLFWKGGTEIPPTGFSLVDLIMCCSSSCIQQLTTHTT